MQWRLRTPAQQAGLKIFQNNLSCRLFLCIQRTYCFRRFRLIRRSTHFANSGTICIIPTVSACQAPWSFPRELRELETSIVFPLPPPMRRERGPVREPRLASQASRAAWRSQTPRSRNPGPGASPATPRGAGGRGPVRSARPPERFVGASPRRACGPAAASWNLR